MTVLFLSLDLFSYGGIQRYSRYLLAVLSRIAAVEDVRTASLAPKRPGGFPQPLPVDVTGGAAPFAKARFVLRALRLAQACCPSVIICDHIHLAPLAYAYRLLTGTPFWVNVYAIDVWGDLPWLRRRAMHAATRIVSDCEFTARYLSARYPTLASRISVVPDCVDGERFTPANAAATSARDAPVILTVSRLAPGRSKGHESVMRALVALRERRIEARYVIAGDGDDRPRLARLATDLGLGDRVSFLGAIDDADLPDVYRACDVFVLVSGFQIDGKAQGEGVPLVVLEAQACGKPVITSASDGSAESIIDGETGLLVTPDDTQALGTALERLLLDHRLRTRMGAAARELALRQFSERVFEERIGAIVAAFAGVGQRMATIEPAVIRR